MPLNCVLSELSPISAGKSNHKYILEKLKSAEIRSKIMMRLKLSLCFNNNSDALRNSTSDLPS